MPATSNAAFGQSGTVMCSNHGDAIEFIELIIGQIVFLEWQNAATELIPMILVFFPYQV